MPMGPRAWMRAVDEAVRRLRATRAALTLKSELAVALEASRLAAREKAEKAALELARVQAALARDGGLAEASELSERRGWKKAAARRMIREFAAGVLAFASAWGCAVGLGFDGSKAVEYRLGEGAAACAANSEGFRPARCEALAARAGFEWGRPGEALMARVGDADSVDAEALGMEPRRPWGVSDARGGVDSLREIVWSVSPKAGAAWAELKDGSVGRSSAAGCGMLTVLLVGWWMFWAALVPAGVEKVRGEAESFKRFWRARPEMERARSALEEAALGGAVRRGKARSGAEAGRL